MKLDPFTTGYMEAVRADAQPLPAHLWPKPKDFVPMARDRAVEDCARFRAANDGQLSAEDGAAFWKRRQLSELPDFPRLYPMIGLLDRKVRFHPTDR